MNFFLYNIRFDDLPDQTKYCLKAVLQLNKSHKEHTLFAISCSTYVPENYISLLRHIMANTLRGSATFLHIIAFGLYALHPSMCQGIGQCLMWLTAMMSLKGLFNIIVIAGIGQRHFSLCVGIGLGMQFSWLASQMWQIVVAYQIWSTFKPDAVGIPNSGIVHHYYRCQVLAWGVPLFNTIVTLTSDLTSLVPEELKPYLGHKKCWFPNEYRKFIYTVALVDFTEVVLLVLFVATLIRLKKCHKDCTEMRSSLNAHHIKTIHWYKVYIRLCFLMGSAYCLVTVTNFITWNYKNIHGIPEFLVRTVVDIERMRGVEIFFIFILEKETLTLLIKKLHNLRQQLF